MVTSRRDFLTEASAIGMGSYFLVGGILKADETTPQAPPASMVFETILTEGVAELSYLIGDKATGKAAVIDPRRDYVPGSTYIFLPELEEKAKRLDKARPLAVYCDSGYRASLAASLLLRMGFTDVHNVPGSWKAWKTAGYEVQMPTERKKGTETNLT